MFKFSNSVIKYSKNRSSIQALFRCTSSSTAAETKSFENDGGSSKLQEAFIQEPRANRSMVAAAFAALQADKNGVEIQTPRTDERVQQAKTVDELLAISEGSGISRKHALKVVSVLSDWCQTGRAQLSEFEADPRFLRLCRTLTKTASRTNKPLPGIQSEDLSTVLNVTADDEAAKLIGSITLPQMVKVLSTLSFQKRRSTSLLRALSYNISASPEKLNIKQCADVLYSAAVLNFYDPNLLEKVCIDICFGINPELNKSAVIGSIFTSLGLLKYKDIGVLDTLSEWILKHHEICRPQDLFAFIQTLAVLNHQPSNADVVFPKLMPYVTYSEANNPHIWLDLVWSLVLLRLATAEHVSTVLSETFVRKIQDSKSPNIPAAYLKLLNTDAYTKHFLSKYDGPKLDSNIKKIDISRNKSKHELVESVLDTLKNLMSSETCLRTNINTDMGFIIDAECILDKKGNSVPLSKAGASPDYKRVAILVHDYHDMCRGRLEPTGVNLFISNILEAEGYKVLTVPYVEFRPRDKLIRRVQYIESKLKQIAQM